MYVCNSVDAPSSKHKKLQVKVHMPMFVVVFSLVFRGACEYIVTYKHGLKPIHRYIVIHIYGFVFMGHYLACNIRVSVYVEEYTNAKSKKSYIYISVYSDFPYHPLYSVYFCIPIDV